MTGPDGKWNKNISPVNWYVAWILVRFEWDDENKNNPNRRCLAWENQIIIKATTPEEAYAKAVEHGKLEEESESWEEGNEDRKGRWRFEGLTNLLPIYHDLEDGAEIVWNEYKNRSVKKVQSWAKPKEALDVFNFSK